MLVALIKQGQVVGIASVDDHDLTALNSIYESVIDISNLSPMPTIGMSFNGQTIVGTSNSMRITKLAMRGRFRTTELLNILAYINVNPVSVVAVLWSNLQVSTFIDLSRPDTIAGVQYLTTVLQAGSSTDYLLTPTRANEILTTPATLTELYTGLN